MSFFSTELYQQIGLGFVLGTALVLAANAGEWSDQISPPAQAAETPQTPQPSAEFLIQPVT